MTIRVDPNWWQTLFDEVYLTTDARSVGDPLRTAREVDIFLGLTQLPTDAVILDLCGGHGRHALEMARRGYAHCTVLDFAEPLLKLGRQAAAAENLDLVFVQGDARSTGLPDNHFDQIFILGNSLGYITVGPADGAILAEARRLLKPGGGILLDVTDGDALRDTFTPNAWHEIGDQIVVCRQRQLANDTINVREMVLDKQAGLIRDQNYGMRIYDTKALQALVEKAGFGRGVVHDNLQGAGGSEDLGFMNHRVILTARNP